MPTNSTPLDQVEWVKSNVIKVADTPQPDGQWLYSIWLPHFLATWDVFAVWEKERLASMEKHLKKGDVLFDIGTEVGWMNIIYAQFVGPENMVLMEPTTAFWQNIIETWTRNFPGIAPLACYNGLISDKTTGNPMIYPRGFPPVEGELIHSMAYTYIHEHGETAPQLTLDDFVDRTGTVPKALTIDVEGAELLVLEGAQKTLADNDLLVWVSIHPDLGKRDYDLEQLQVHRYMVALGYVGEYLATDHEQHWLFRRPTNV